MRAIGILLFAPLLTCGGLPIDYSYGISPNFTPHQQELIIEALHDWENVVNDKSILNITNIHVGGKCDGGGQGDTCIILLSEAIPRVANVCNQQYELGCCVRDASAGEDDQFPQIVMDTDTIASYGDKIFGSNDALFKETALHEIGHSLALAHHSSKVLMNPVAKYASPTITCDDLQQFYSLRGIHRDCPQGLY